MEQQTSPFRARFWTKTEVKETLKEGVKMGYDVSEKNSIWSITDPEKNDTLVFRALILEGEKNVACRVNSNYFNI
jgi:hypothetical protein